MKIISSLREFINHLFGWGTDGNTLWEDIDNPVVFPVAPESNTYNIEDNPSLNIPSPLESDIVSLERTKPLEIESEDHPKSEVKDGNISSYTAVEVIAEDKALFSATRFEELLEGICQAIEEFDKKSDNYEKLSGDKVYKFIRSKLTDRLIQSGASIIKDEDSFDLLRHHPVEISDHTEEGCKISETIRPGIEYGGKVYLRAIVKLENV